MVRDRRLSPEAGLVAIACSLLAACGTSGGGAGPGSSSGSSSGGSQGGEDGGDAGQSVEGGAAVSGTVLDFDTHLTLPGRSVFIGSQKATTDGDGGFAIAAAPPVYDLAVVDPDGTTASLYKGVSRRDPRVYHRSSPSSSSSGARAHSATLHGALYGGVSWPLGPNQYASVTFSAPQDTSQFLMGGQIPFRGPSYGPMHLVWDGPSTINGEMLAIAWQNDPDAGTSTWYGQRNSAQVNDGDDAGWGIAFVSPLPQHAPVAGDVQLPSGVTLQAIDVYYDWGLPGAIVPVAGAQTWKTAFSYAVPDFTGLLDGKLCARAYAVLQDTLPRIFDSRCSLAPGAPVTLTLQAPPSLSAPAANAMIKGTTPFTWSSFAGGIYELDLVYGTNPTQYAPNIYVYTADTSTTWPDLTFAGISYPAGSAYSVTLVGVGVFASMDDATGSTGAAAPIVPELRRSSLPPIGVSLGL